MLQFREQYLIHEQDTDTEMTEVVSIHNEIVKLIQLILLDERLMINLGLIKSLYP
jgi:hypothetical protein